MHNSGNASKFHTSSQNLYLNYFQDIKKSFKVQDSIDLRIMEVPTKEAGHTGVNSSLKGRLHLLTVTNSLIIISQDSIHQVAEELNEQRKNFGDLMVQKESIKNTISIKSDNMQRNLKGEIEKVEKEMERHFSHQKAENSRLQQQISQLKTEKTVVQNQLLALQRRIADMELQIGDVEK